MTYIAPDFTTSAVNDLENYLNSQKIGMKVGDSKSLKILFNGAIRDVTISLEKTQGLRKIKGDLTFKTTIQSLSSRKAEVVTCKSYCKSKDLKKLSEKQPQPKPQASQGKAAKILGKALSGKAQKEIKKDLNSEHCKKLENVNKEIKACKEEMKILSKKAEKAKKNPDKAEAYNAKVKKCRDKIDDLKFEAARINEKLAGNLLEKIDDNDEIISPLDASERKTVAIAPLGGIRVEVMSEDEDIWESEYIPDGDGASSKPTVPPEDEDLEKKEID
jgi:hypothetical protein